MLSKVSNRVKRRSVQQTSVVEPQPEAVDSPPDLLRWSDFTNPFPSVTFGGYLRYYKTRTKSENAQAPSFCPLLSQGPQPPSCENPPTSPLFYTPSKRCLSVIHEASMESMTPNKPRTRSLTTDSSPKSLRRRKRQLLRTPSIERDFAGHARQLFASNISISESSSSREILLSHDFSHSPSSDSHCSQSDSNHSEYPITPSASADGEHEGDVFEEGELEKGFLSVNYDSPKRPGSMSSFNTAKSSLSDHD